MASLIKQNFMHAQRGQAMIYITAMLAVMALGVAYVYNAGLVSNEKTRLQNTTDAVAYSVAIIEAKDLNFKAYTNRAMVANQIAVAQAVGMVSWLRWLQNTSNNISAVTSWIPFVNGVTRAIATAARALSRGGQIAMRAMAAIADGTIRVLSGSQSIMHFATIGIARETLTDVAQANDPQINTALSFRDAIFWNSLRMGHLNFTRRYNPDAVRNGGFGRAYRENKQRMDEFRKITLDSRDPFSRARNYRFGPRITIPFFERYEMRKRGGTEMFGSNNRAQYYTWAAMDTLSMHRSRYRCRRFRCRFRGWREFFQIGWGAAQASQARETIFYSRKRGANFGGTWGTNPRASRTAAIRYQGAQNVYSGFGGLQAFYDIRQQGLIDQAPGIMVLLTKDNTANAVKTMKTTGFNRNGSKLDIESDGGMMKNRLHAVSRATPYFSRPDDLWSRGRNAGREYGNLYNPYWQARLSNVSDTALRRTQLLARTL